MALAFIKSPFATFRDARSVPSGSIRLQEVPENDRIKHRFVRADEIEEIRCRNRDLI